MGGLWRKLPVTFWTWMAATLAIAGFPFVTAGFYSKDSILAALHMAEGPYAGVRHACMWALVAGAFLTAAYMMRVTALAFFGKPREQERYDHAHESWSMTAPLVVLGLLAIVGGFTWSEHFLRPGGLVGEWAEEAYHHAHGAVGPLAIAAGVGGLLFGAFLYGFFAWESAPGAALRAALRKPLAPLLGLWKAKYWMDEIYAATFVAAGGWFSRLFARFDRDAVDGLVNAAGRGAVRASDVSGWVDREVVDGQLVHGAANVAWGTGGVFSRMQGGRVRVYAYQAILTTAILALVIAVLNG